MSATTDPYREWDAAYVLGALGPAERREYEEHLDGCDACRAAVAELAGVPGLLASVPAEHALATDPRDPTAGPADGGGHAGGDDGDGGGRADVVPLATLAGAARRSRRRRRSLVAVAASALLVGGVGAGLALGGAGEGPGEGPVPAPSSPAPVAQSAAVELEPVGAVDVRASLTATAKPWGTSLEWSCTYPPRAGRYDPAAAAGYALVLVDRDGGRTVAATWTGSGTESTGLGASSSLPLDRIARVEITRAGGETLSAAAL